MASANPRERTVMILRTIVCLGFMLVCLTGCLDHWYPHNLSGRVDGGLYSNQTRTGRLSSLDRYQVLVPQDYNIYQKPMMEADEFSREDYTAVSFGPTATDSTIYRLMLIEKKERPLAAIHAKYFPLFIQTVDAGAQNQMERIYRTETVINDKPAIYTVYEALGPDVYNYVSERQPGNVITTHAEYVIDYGKYAALFWIQYSSNSSVNRIDKHAKKLILAQAYLPQLRFVQSLRINEFHDKP